MRKSRLSPEYWRRRDDEWYAKVVKAIAVYTALHILVDAWLRSGS